ncbi:hypothetical protein [Acinetobacter sp. GXMZU3951]|jgi:hypothetical protein
MFGKQKIQHERKSPLKMLIVVGLVAAALLASAGIFYYYVIFAPRLEQQKFDLQQQQIKQKQEEQNALKKKQWQMEQRKQHYQNCINDADQVYSNDWANTCQRLVEQSQNDLENCLKDPSVMLNPFKGESYCLKIVGNTEFNPDCELPVELAEQLERNRAQRKEACASDAQNIVFE